MVAPLISLENSPPFPLPIKETFKWTGGPEPSLSYTALQDVTIHLPHIIAIFVTQYSTAH